MASKEMESVWNLWKEMAVDDNGNHYSGTLDEFEKQMMDGSSREFVRKSLCDNLIDNDGNPYSIDSAAFVNNLFNEPLEEKATVKASENFDPSKGVFESSDELNRVLQYDFENSDIGKTALKNYNTNVRNDEQKLYEQFSTTDTYKQWHDFYSGLYNSGEMDESSASEGLRSKLTSIFNSEYSEQLNDIREKYQDQYASVYRDYRVSDQAAVDKYYYGMASLLKNNKLSGEERTLWLQQNTSGDAALDAAKEGAEKVFLAALKAKNPEFYELYKNPDAIFYVDAAKSQKYTTYGGAVLSQDAYKKALRSDMERFIDSMPEKKAYDEANSKWLKAWSDNQRSAQKAVVSPYLDRIKKLENKLSDLETSSVVDYGGYAEKTITYSDNKKAKAIQNEINILRAICGMYSIANTTQNAPYHGASGYKSFKKGASVTASDPNTWLWNIPELVQYKGTIEPILVKNKYGTINKESRKRYDELSVKKNLSEEEKTELNSLQKKIDSTSALTEDESALLDAMLYKANVEQMRAGTISNAYQGANIMVNSLAFMTEFLLTGGLGSTAANKAGTWYAKRLIKKIGKDAFDDMLKAGTKQLALYNIKQGLVRNTARSLYGFVAQPFISPSAYTSVGLGTALGLDSNPNYGKDTEGVDTTHKYITTEGNSLWKEWWKAAGEIGTESLGSFLELGIMSRALNKLAKSYHGKAPIKNFGKVLYPLIAKGSITLDRFGIQNFPAEIAEEVFNNGWNAIGADLAKDKKWAEDNANFWSSDSWQQMVIGFGSIPFMGGMHVALDYLGARRNAKHADQDIRKTLVAMGREEDAELLISELDKCSDASQVAELMKTFLGEHEYTTSEIRDINKSVLMYLSYKARYDSYTDPDFDIAEFYRDSNRQISEAELESALSSSIATNLSTLRNEDSGNIEEVVLSDGSRMFLMSTIGDNIIVQDINGKSYLRKKTSIVSQKTVRWTDDLAQQTVRDALTNQGGMRGVIAHILAARDNEINMKRMNAYMESQLEAQRTAAERMREQTDAQQTANQAEAERPQSTSDAQVHEEATVSNNETAAEDTPSEEQSADVKEGEDENAPEEEQQELTQEQQEEAYQQSVLANAPVRDGEIDVDKLKPEQEFIYTMREHGLDQATEDAIAELTDLEKSTKGTRASRRKKQQAWESMLAKYNRQALEDYYTDKVARMQAEAEKQKPNIVEQESADVADAVPSQDAVPVPDAPIIDVPSLIDLSTDDIVIVRDTTRSNSFFARKVEDPDTMELTYYKLNPDGTNGRKVKVGDTNRVINKRVVYTKNASGDYVPYYVLSDEGGNNWATQSGSTSIFVFPVDATEVSLSTIQSKKSDVSGNTEKLFFKDTFVKNEKDEYVPINNMYNKNVTGGIEDILKIKESGRKLDTVLNIVIYEGKDGPVTLRDLVGAGYLGVKGRRKKDEKRMNASLITGWSKLRDAIRLEVESKYNSEDKDAIETSIREIENEAIRRISAATDAWNTIVDRSGLQDYFEKNRDNFKDEDPYVRMVDSFEIKTPSLHVVKPNRESLGNQKTATTEKKKNVNFLVKFFETITLADIVARDMVENGVKTDSVLSWFVEGGKAFATFEEAKEWAKEMIRRKREAHHEEEKHEAADASENNQQNILPDEEKGVPLQAVDVPDVDTRFMSERELASWVLNYVSELAGEDYTVDVCESVEEILSMIANGEIIASSAETQQIAMAGNDLDSFKARGGAIIFNIPGLVLFAKDNDIDIFEAARRKFVHEAQHIINKDGAKAYARKFENEINIRRDALAELVTKISGVETYGTFSFESLADELICRLVEISSSENDAAKALREYGIEDESIINFIVKIENEQRSSLGLYRARRKQVFDQANQGGRQNASRADSNNSRRNGEGDGLAEGGLQENTPGSGEASRELDEIDWSITGKPYLNDQQKVQELNDRQRNADIIDFSITKRTVDTVVGWLNKRNDLTEEDKATVLLWIDETFKNEATRLAAAKWFVIGSVKIHEDDAKIAQAMSVARKNKQDALLYDNPMDIILRYPDSVKEPPIDPDTIPTLIKVRTIGDVTIYDIDETSYEGAKNDVRQALRQIINTHLGKKTSPWCLLQGDKNGNLTTEYTNSEDVLDGALAGLYNVNSEYYWDYYCAYPKQVAFRNGRIYAFSANSDDDIVWWNLKDELQGGLPITIKGTNGILRKVLSDNDGGIISELYTYRETGSSILFYDESGNVVEIQNKDDGSTEIIYEYGYSCKFTEDEFSILFNGEKIYSGKMPVDIYVEETAIDIFGNTIKFEKSKNIDTEKEIFHLKSIEDDNRVIVFDEYGNAREITYKHDNAYTKVYYQQDTHDIKEIERITKIKNVGEVHSTIENDKLVRGYVIDPNGKRERHDISFDLVHRFDDELGRGAEIKFNDSAIVCISEVNGVCNISFRYSGGTKTSYIIDEYIDLDNTKNDKIYKIVEDLNDLFHGYDLFSVKNIDGSYSISFKYFDDTEINFSITKKSQESILQEINEERAAIESSAKENGTWLKAPNGLETKLTEKQWIDVRTSRFIKWFGDWINNPENASLAIDEETGEPKVLYRGSKRGNWTPHMSDTSEGLYYTDNIEVARYYAMGTRLTNKETDPYETERIKNMSVDELFEKNIVSPCFVNVRNAKVIDYNGRKFWQGLDAPVYRILDEYEEEQENNSAPSIIFESENLDDVKRKLNELGRNEEDYIEFQGDTDTFISYAKKEGYESVYFTNIDDGAHIVANEWIVLDPHDAKSAIFNNGIYSNLEDDIRFSITHKKPHGGEGESNVDGFIAERSRIANKVASERREMGKKVDQIWLGKHIHMFDFLNGKFGNKKLGDEINNKIAALIVQAKQLDNDATDSGLAVKALIGKMNEWRKNHGLPMIDVDRKDIYNILNRVAPSSQSLQSDFVNTYAKRMYAAVDAMCKEIDAKLSEDGKTFSMVDGVDKTRYDAYKAVEFYLMSKDNIERALKGENERIGDFEGRTNKNPFEYAKWIEENISSETIKNLRDSVKAATDYSADLLFANGLITELEYGDMKSKRWYVPEKNFIDINNDLAEALYINIPKTTSQSKVKPAGTSHTAKGAMSMADSPLAQILYDTMNNIVVVQRNKAKKVMFDIMEENSDYASEYGMTTNKRWWILRDTKQIADLRRQITDLEDRERLLRDIEGNTEGADAVASQIKNLEDKISELIKGKRVSSVSEDLFAEDRETMSRIARLREELNEAIDTGNMGYIREVRNNLRDAIESLHVVSAKIETKNDVSLTGKRENSIVELYVNGQLIEMDFNGLARVADALNGVYRKDGTIGEIRKLVSGYAALQTTYNPFFFVTNMEKDIPVIISGGTAKYGAYFPGMFTRELTSSTAVMDYINGNLDKTTEEGKRLWRFLEMGGNTGFIETYDLNALRRSVRRSVTGKSHRIKDLSVISGLEAINQWSELKTRYAAYCAVLDLGYSENEALIAAKNLSVNFNRKGAGNKFFNLFNSVSMFSNANIQGAKTSLAFFKIGKLGIKGTAMLMNMAVLGYLATWMNPDDPDKNKVFSDWLRENYILIGDHIKVPLPPELRPYWNFGVQMRLFVEGKKNWDDVVYSVSSVAFQELIPLPTNLKEAGVRYYDMMTGRRDVSIGDMFGTALHTMNPASVNNALNISENKNFLGSALRYDTDTDAQYLHGGTATQLSKDISKLLFDSVHGDDSIGSIFKFGGELNEKISPMADWNPKQIDALMGLFVPSDWIKIANLVWTGGKYVASGEGEIRINQVPLLSRNFHAIDPSMHAYSVYKELNDLFKAVEGSNGQFSTLKNAMKRQSEIMELSDPNSEEYSNAKSEYERVEAEMQRLTEGLPNGQQTLEEWAEALGEYKTNDKYMYARKMGGFTPEDLDDMFEKSGADKPYDDEAKLAAAVKIQACLNEYKAYLRYKDSQKQMLEDGE